VKYRAEIDGLRALAVVPVILFHGGIEYFKGGFVGVDIFFVISGYLITTIIIEELAAKRFSITNFYERRARRILPALFVVVFAVSIISLGLMTPIEIRGLGNALMGVASFSSNIVFWRTQGYFDDLTELNPLIHTWSLAVEEQFYIIFPIFLLVMWRYGKNRLIWMIILLSLFSLLLSEWGWRNNPIPNFYLAPTRAWEMFAGVLAALLLYKQKLKPSNKMSLLGLAGMVVALIFYDDNTPFPSVYTLLPVTSVFLIIVYGGTGTVVARILSTKLFVGLGLISYSAYLWHQPLFAFYRLQMKTLKISTPILSLLIIMSFILAYLSWKFIERPIRNKELLKKSSVFILSTIGLVFIGSIGFLSKEISYGYEHKLAKELAAADYIYFQNLDERKFLEGRLLNPLKKVDTIIMGSSRSMQIDSRSIKNRALNISISSANIEDFISFVPEATAKLKPTRVILGTDPWLFNKYPLESTLASTSKLFQYWNEKIRKNLPVNEELVRYFKYEKSGQSETIMQKFYYILNNSTSIADNGRPESINKKAYDGFLIYNKKAKNNIKITKEDVLRSGLGYKMIKYEYASRKREIFINLINWLKSRDINITLILSPYHPKVYKFLISKNKNFLFAEDMFNKLAKDLDINLIGSYNPNLVDCGAEEFYDSIHPKHSCMSKILRQFSTK